MNSLYRNDTESAKERQIKELINWGIPRDTLVLESM